MTAPIGYLRMKREGTARRRLELAKMLRQDPSATNIELAKALNVNRDTIALDRKALIEMVKNDAKSETELLRGEMVEELESLKVEVEKHRKDGKLSLQAVDRLLDITKAIIELTGVRKPVTEQKNVSEHRRITFETEVVRTSPPFAKAEVITEPHALGAGDEQS